MSFLDSLRNFVSETEADVLKIVILIKTDAEVLEKDIANVLHWVASNTPAIAADIEKVVSIIETVGLSANPEVGAAISAANLAVQGLNAFAAASNAGNASVDAVLAGYTAVKQAQAAVASAAAITVATPTTSTKSPTQTATNNQAG